MGVTVYRGRRWRFELGQHLVVGEHLAVESSKVRLPEAHKHTTSGRRTHATTLGGYAQAQRAVTK